MIKLVVFEAQTLYRLGVKEAFKGNPEIRVAGEAHNGLTLFSVLADTPADLLLLGINLHDEIECMDVAHRLRHDYPAMKILAVVNEDTDLTVQTLITTGINGYIGKRQASRHELEKAIRTVAAGRNYIGRIDRQQWTIKI